LENRQALQKGEKISSTKEKKKTTSSSGVFNWEKEGITELGGKKEKAPSSGKELVFNFFERGKRAPPFP